MDNKLAVMQPYLFPYLGYFQLINAVDYFVFYDDVNYIKQGWINRNKILVNGRDHIFTVPLKKASSFSLIKDTELHPALFYKWKPKFLKSIEQAYKKAPFYKEILPIIEKILDTPGNSISILAEQSVMQIALYLNIKAEFRISSVDFPETKGLEKADRLVEISRKTNTNNYINPIGGKELYEKSFFEDKGVQLDFIKSTPVEYKQFKNEFIPWLSIIDVLMFNSIEETKGFLNQFELT